MAAIRSHVSGAGGRLGRVIVETLKRRGDEITRDLDALNYLVFAHRYRGEPSYDDEMGANVTGVVDTIDATTWAAGERSVVIVSSVCATEPAMNQSLAYNVSKAALNQVARYYAKKGLRVNTVSPAGFTGLDAVVTKQEVANVVAFLCSPLASGISGQDLRVTGRVA